MYPGTLYPSGKTNQPWKNPVLGASPVYSWFFTPPKSRKQMHIRGFYLGTMSYGVVKSGTGGMGS